MEKREARLSPTAACIIAELREKGREDGKKEGKRDALICRLANKNYSNEEITEITKLTLEEVIERRKTLKSLLRRN